jgi:hypothetical protein
MIIRPLTILLIHIDARNVKRVGSDLVAIGRRRLVLRIKGAGIHQRLGILLKIWAHSRVGRVIQAAWFNETAPELVMGPMPGTIRSPIPLHLKVVENQHPRVGVG